MFGGDDIAATRASSPWDSLLASSPPQEGSLDTTRINTSIPRLVPEVEEGNVEYKLKLTNISDARFARLVTQLKWRLLEGSGQAYYELGVADSGALIGLSRADLEESLETLDMMAGEIGASVIVVKEIEVPPAMVALAEISEYIDPETGEWTDKMVNKKARRLIYETDTDSGLETSALSENETDASMTECTDTEPPSSVITPPDVDTSLSGIVATCADRFQSSNPERPTAQSSPFIAPLDDDLALFSMEPEPDLMMQRDTQIPSPLALGEPISDVSLDIEIASVFKRRPLRRRPATSVAGSTGRKGHKGKGGKRPQPWHDPTYLTASSPTGTANGPPETVPNKQEVKALQRRLARDRRREAKRIAQAAIVHADGGPDGGLVASLVVQTEASSQNDSVGKTEVDELVADLNELVVDVKPGDLDEVKAAKAVPSGFAETGVDAGSLAIPQIAVEISREPRLIVEALVVRKLSIDEAFLDFGGF